MSMDLPSRFCARIDAVVDEGINVRRWRVVRVVGELKRLALVGQNPSHKLRALNTFMCLGQQKNNKLTTNCAELCIRIKK